MESSWERGRQTEAGANPVAMAGKPLGASQLLAIDVTYTFLVIRVLSACKTHGELLRDPQHQFAGSVTDEGQLSSRS